MKLRTFLHLQTPYIFFAFFLIQIHKPLFDLLSQMNTANSPWPKSVIFNS
jgi:hypothetical protein